MHEHDDDPTSGDVLATPLFQSPPADLDESWTWGFLTGGMTSVDAEYPADDYLLAADTMAEAALASRDAAYLYGNAVLYLYRHAPELYLKQIVRPSKRSHDLDWLLATFETIVRRDLKQSVPPVVLARLREWAQHDPGSFRWRYCDVPPGDELWIDLRHVRVVMNYLAENFRRIRKPLR